MLSSGETNELGASERESSRHEHRADSLESIGESSGIVPKSSSPVLIVETVTGATSKYEDQARDQEDDNDGELQA